MADDEVHKRMFLSLQELLLSPYTQVSEAQLLFMAYSGKDWEIHAQKPS